MHFVFNPLWERSKGISFDDVKTMITLDKNKPDIVIKSREYLTSNTMGFEAYLRDIPYVFGTGSLPNDAIEDLAIQLEKEGYDQSVINQVNRYLRKLAG